MKNFKASILYVLSVHIMALIMMSVQRIVLLSTNLQHIEKTSDKVGLISSALLHGVWFDNVVACYISILPLVVLCIAGLFNKISKIVINIFNVYYIIIYTLVFAIGAADIPYFNYFFKHLNTSIFNWNEEGGTTMEMILQETSYYIYMVLFLLMIALFGYLIVKLSKKLIKKQQGKANIYIYIY
jgi:hypothetical protein